MVDIDTIVPRAPYVQAFDADAPLAARSRVKRGLDVALATGILLLMLPMLLAITFAIKIQDGGPALFLQRRTGLNGKTFVIYKFRSMSVAEDGPALSQVVRGDRRVTPVGRVLRMLSLDELPQLFNVLKGEMSFVGPRPHALGHDQQWCANLPTYNARFRARPGLTGYAQVAGWRGEVRTFDDIRGRVDADNHYIDNWSLELELSILLRTVPLLFRDPRAY